MEITLKAARTNAGLTQKQAAKALDIAVDTLSNYERGRTFPDVPTIKKMEKLYGVHYNDIIFLPKDYGLTVNNLCHKEE